MKKKRRNNKTGSLKMMSLSRYIDWKRMKINEAIRLKADRRLCNDLNIGPKAIADHRRDRAYGEYLEQYRAASLDWANFSDKNPEKNPYVLKSYENYLESCRLEQLRREEKEYRAQAAGEIYSAALDAYDENLLFKKTETLFSFITSAGDDFLCTSNRLELHQVTNTKRGSKYKTVAIVCDRENIFDFAEALSASITGFFADTDFMGNGENGILGVIRKKVVEDSEKLKEYDTDLLRDILNSEVEKIISGRKIFLRSMNMLREYYTKEKIISLLWQNKTFGAMLKSIEEEERRKREIETGIITRMPERYIDMYPRARSIRRKFVLHIGPTNSGKTYNALLRMKQAESGVYLAPLRLLACEIADTVNSDNVKCSLKTGEEAEIIEGARHISSTIEMLDFDRHYEVAVIDEAQLIKDPQRGGNWTAAVLGVFADEVHVCMAPHAQGIIEELIKLCGDSWECEYHERLVPIQFDSRRFNFPQSVRPGDALIVFRKADALHVAGELQQKGIGASVVYGALPYDVRHSEVDRFSSGETEVIVATDAIGMGMNLPIKRVVFLGNKKFDGRTFRGINAEEVQQIAGRAGRFGRYNIGTYSSQFMRLAIDTMYHDTIPDIDIAYIKFPRQLLNIEGKISELMKQWQGLSVEGGPFIKADLSHELGLCAMIEKETEDKELVYEFITMPFNEDDDDLLKLWYRLFMCTLKGEVYPFNSPDYHEEELSSMEYAVRECDLMFCYSTKYNPSECDLIAASRRIICKKIIEYLKTHELPVKTCSCCGTPLTWNYPYSRCDECFATGRTE